MPTVGEIIRQRRQALDLTLEALARQVGATKSYLSMIENHRVAHPPSEPLLAALERALDIGGGELLRAAQWQNTPAPVRAELRRLAVAAERGQDLARWLKASAGKRRGGGRNLDQLFRSGELGRRVNSTLASDAAKPAAAVKSARSAGPSASAPGGGGETSAGSLDSRVPVRFQVPLINRVAAGYPTEFTDLDYPVRVADEYVACPDLADPQAFAARVVGDSMLPDYRAGDVVVFSPAAPVGDGADCFVRLEPDHESTFKRVFIEPDGTHLRLQPLNPKFPPSVVERQRVAGLYKAVWRISRLP